MSLFNECASLFIVGFPGVSPDAEVKKLISDGIGGVILFKRNVENAPQIASLVRELKTHAARPLIASVDQEGGRVARLRGAPFTALPPMRQLGTAGDLSLVERAGRLLALECRAMGFDFDFAPVVDVDTNPANPVIGDRSFHREAMEVAKLGIALARGLEAGGVASCAKHFPGHGDTSQDSHHDLPSLPHGLERLRSVELLPFAAYAQAELASVMTAHVIFEALDKGVPATMSKKVMDGVLRRELGFMGVVVSDDLEMKAIASHFSIERAVVEGVNAGVDSFLVCHHADVQRAAIESLVHAVEKGVVSRERLDEARGRVAKLVKRFVHGPEDLLSTLGTREHEAMRAGLSVDTFTGRDPTEVAWAR